MASKVKRKIVEYCESLAPIHENMQCQKPKGHKGTHKFKGYSGIFQQCKIKVEWGEK